MATNTAAKMDDWLTPYQIAEQLDRKVLDVLKWIHSGELRAVNVANGQRDANGNQAPPRRPTWRIRKVDFAAFLERRSTQPPPPRKRQPLSTRVTNYF